MRLIVVWFFSKPCDILVARVISLASSSASAIFVVCHLVIVGIVVAVIIVVISVVRLIVASFRIHRNF